MLDIWNWHLVFLSALIYNLFLLINNRFFTNNKYGEVFPEVFSKFGQAIIILFGFIYYYSYNCCASHQIFLFFAIVKFMYVAA